MGRANFWEESTGKKGPCGQREKIREEGEIQKRRGREGKSGGRLQGGSKRKHGKEGWIGE